MTKTTADVSEIEVKAYKHVESIEPDLDMVDETTGPFLAALLNAVYWGGS